MVRAIIPGSFDPITNGHVDLIRRAAALFDEVTALVMVNDKKTPMFSADERVNLVCESISDIKNAKCEFFGGMTYDYIADKHIDVIIKGVRNEQDFAYECQIAQFNKEHAPKAETMFIYSEPRLRTISSGKAKKALVAGEDISEMVPKCVLAALKEKLK